MTDIEKQLQLTNAETNLGFYVRHYFDRWKAGDETGRRNAFFGAKRCLHVLRVLPGITTTKNNDNKQDD